MLLAAELLLPIDDPVAEVPVLALGLPEAPVPALEPTTAADSSGRSVTLAFTGDRALAAWNRRHRHRVALDGRALLALVRGSSCPSLVLNAAGPASLELSRSQLDALLDGGELTEGDDPAQYVVEPLREALPEGFVRFAAAHAEETEEIREAFLFSIVSEGTGSRPALALVVDVSTDARRRREITIDAGERLVLGRGRKRVSVPVVVVEERGLLEWLRRHATRLR